MINVNRGPFRWAHGVWAFLGAGVCVLLIFSGGGHPPPIVLVPAVVPVWLLGHLLLWISRRLMIRGRITVTGSESEARPWPLGLVAAALGTGAVFLVGSVQLVISAVLQRPYPYRGSLWIAGVFVWAVHSAGFLGLLLRRGWTRLLLAGLCSAWALYLVWQTIEHLVRGGGLSLEELAFAVTLVGLFTFLGFHLIASRRVREFLSLAGDAQT